MQELQEVSHQLDNNLLSQIWLMTMVMKLDFQQEKGLHQAIHLLHLLQILTSSR